MQEIITNAATGKVTIRDFTPAEIAAMQPSTASQRAAMKCSRMQGIRALGKARWEAVLAYRATAPWDHQIVIDEAGEWNRNSASIALFGAVLNMTDAEIDGAFVAAMGISA